MGLFSDIEKQYQSRQATSSTPAQATGPSIFDAVEKVGASQYLQQQEDERKRKQAQQDALNQRLVQRKAQIQADQKNMKSTSNPGGIEGAAKALAEGGYDFGRHLANGIASTAIRAAQGAANIESKLPFVPDYTKKGLQNYQNLDPNIVNKVIAENPNNDTQGRSRILGTVGDVAGAAATTVPMLVATGGVGDAAESSSAVKALSQGGKIAQAGAKVLPRVAGSAANSATIAAQDYLGGNKQNIGKDIAIGTALDVAAPVVGKVVSKILSKGPGAAIKELIAQKALRDSQLLKADDATKLPAAPERLGLPSPRPGTSNTSTLTTPATPATIPMTEEEYTARFNKLSRSHDSEVRKLEKSTADLKKPVIQDEIHQRYADQLNQLNDEFMNGKPNPDYKPETTTPSGFTLVQPTAKNPQLDKLQKRVKQIDSIISNVQKNGVGNRSVDDVRSLIAERRQAQSVLDGKTPYEDVYGAAAHAVPTTTTKSPTPTQIQQKIYADSSSYMGDLTAAQEAARKSSNASPIQKVSAALQDFRTKFADSNTPIEDALALAKKNGAEITPENDVHYQIDSVLRSGDQASQFAKDHGLEKLIQEVPDLDEANQYMLARHAADLAQNGIETGRNAAADAKLVTDLAPTYEPFAKQLTDYSHALLDKISTPIDQGGYGLVSQRTAQALKSEYPNYVPVNRIIDEVDNVASHNSAGVASVSTQSVVRAIKGSTRQMEDPIASMLVKTDDAFRQGERNKAAAMIASYKDAPGNPFQLRELAKDEAIGTKPTISFLDNGVKRTFETTREIADAAKSMNAQQFGLWGKIFSYPTRILRLGATSLSLPFTGANPVKDQVSAFINSDRAMKTSIANPGNFLKALFNAVGNGPEYENLIRNAAGGTSYDISREGVKLSIDKIRASRSVKSNIAYHVTHPADMLRAVEDIVGKSENLTRIQQFTGTRDALIKRGISPEEANILAAEAARKNTTNFARSGTWGRVINSTNPFFNAGIQGSRTLIRSLKEHPVQTSAKIALTAFAPTAIATAWNLSDPNRKAAYDDIKDYEKEGNLILLPPNPVKDPKTGKWNAIKIPMSQEIAQLTSVVRNGIEAAYKDKNFNTSALLTNLLGTATSLNVNSTREFANQAIPQGIKPFIENVTNQNLFTGNQIVPDNQLYLPGNEQVKPTSSGTLSTLANTGVGKALNLSPEKLENFIGTAAGGLGRQVLNLADRGVAATNGGATPISGQDPVTGIGGRFSGASGGGNVDDFYSAYKPALNQKLKMSDKINALINNGQPAQAQRMVRDYNASVDKLFAPMRAKYGNQFDDQIASLKYSDSVAAIKRRETTQRKKNK